jgi:hypothetical protein
MSAYLTIKVLGVVSAVVGPMPDWNTCTDYLPDFQKRADLLFQHTDLDAYKDFQKRYPGIKRTDIVHECTETKPEIAK